MSAIITPKVAELLDDAVAHINTKDFIADDPVQFPRRFTDLRDIEITALLVSTIAWGNRKMILRDARRMLDIMQNRPYEFVAEGCFEHINDSVNVHRTFFGRNLKHFLRGLRDLYARYDNLDTFCRASGSADAELPAWHLARCLNGVLADANKGTDDSRCLPLNTDASALKRLNMALRWLVRDDGIVDLGVWKSLKPSQLFIPLDVHSGRTARTLGLLERRADDRRAVVALTEALRTLRPDDPAVYDFALFGIGVSGKALGEI